MEPLFFLLSNCHSLITRFRQEVRVHAHTMINESNYVMSTIALALFKTIAGTDNLIRR